MEVRWQCKLNGNMDLVATSYDGKLACSNQYNTENGAHYEDMMSAERDACVFYNVERIEAAIKAGKFFTIGDSKVPVVDGTPAANKDPKTALTCYVPVPKNPHGVNISPDGKYYACSGKLSPTATLIEHELVLKWFNGDLKEPRDAVVAEPEIGLGPLHTGFDGRGNAYTTLFLDSQIVKWNLDAAMKSYKKDVEVCGGDLNVVRTMTVTGNDELWERIIASRKNVFKQAALLGYDTLLLLLLHRITLEGAIKRVTRRVNLTGRALLCPYAEIGMDVDKPHQLELMRADLSRSNVSPVA